MKAVVTSDWHLDAVTVGVNRFDELKRSVLQSVEYTIDTKADYYLFLGDLCDPDSGSSVFRCVELAIWVANTLAEKNIQSMWLAGNHDVIEDGSGDTTLSPLRALSHRHVSVIERPKVFDMEASVMVFLPFTATSHAYNPRDFVRKLPAPYARPLLVAGHLSIPGMTPGEETVDMARGRDIYLPYDDIVAVSKEAMILNGHYHRSTTFHPEPGGPPIRIPGSLARLRFGFESETKPVFLTLTV